MTIDDICLQFKISREQRANEIKNKLGTKGTMGYENMGCYKCTGYNINCDSYLTHKMVYGGK